MFGTNMLIVYFLFIFSNIFFLWDTFFYTRTPAETFTSASLLSIPLHELGHRF